MEKYKKNHAKITNLKYQLQHGMKNLNYLKDYFEYILKKKHEKVTVSPSIKNCINKIENRVTFKIKTRYYLELLTSKTMKLLH